MDGSRHTYKIHTVLLLILVFAFTATSCSDDTFKDDVEGPKDPVAVRFDIGMSGTSTRVFDNTHNINRVLILPFVKTDEILVNSELTFTPLYNFARQIDVTSFPACGIELLLPDKSKTYTVLVVGYNRNDYDFNNRSNPANKFDLSNAGIPANLSNTNITLNQGGASPELFMCQLHAFSGTTDQGVYFKPEQGYDLSGTLTRMVGGISVQLTNVPDYVSSIKLRAEKVSNNIKLTNSYTQSMLSAAGGYVLGTAAPVNNTVSIDSYIMPVYHNLITYTTKLYLDVSYGTTVQTYSVRVLQSSVLKTDFSFKSNEVTQFSGDYQTVLAFGFLAEITIELDDTAWDGIHGL